MPGLQLWRGLAPRRFLIEVILAEVIKATDVLPTESKNGVFAAVTSCPHGFPENLPEGFSVIAYHGEYFIIIKTPKGTTAEELREVLALELMPLFYDCPDEYSYTGFDDKLATWLELEIYGELDEEEEPKMTQQMKEDLDFVCGNGRTPPQYHGWQDDMDGTWSVGEPEVSDQDIQWAEDIFKEYY